MPGGNRRLRKDEVPKWDGEALKLSGLLLRLFGAPLILFASLTRMRTITIPDADGTVGLIPSGSGTADRLVKFSAGTIANSGVSDGTTGGAVLTLAAAASYTLTVPATGTAGLRDVANTWSAANIFTLGSNTPVTITRSDTGATAGNHLAMTTASGGGLQIGVSDLSASNPDWTLATNASEGLRIDMGAATSGTGWYFTATLRLRGGFTTSRTVGGVTNGGKFGIEGTDSPTSSITTVINSNSTAGGSYVRAKTRAAAVLGTTAVADGDTIWIDDWAGADGTDITTIGARIRVFVNGAVSTGIVPMDMRFFTMPAAGTIAERQRIDATGGVQIRSSMSTTSPGIGQLVARAMGTDQQNVSTTGNIASMASDTGFIRMTGAAPVIQGILAPALGTRILRVWVTTTLTVNHQDAAAANADKVITVTGAPVVFAAGTFADFVYDTSVSRWLLRN
jgi:hypothetical protein